MTDSPPICAGMPMPPHRYHNHPIVALYGHDRERIAFVEQLTRAMTEMLVLAATHSGLNEMLDIVPQIGAVIDKVQYESPDLMALLGQAEITHEDAMRHLVWLVREGDMQGFTDYADALERDMPLPIVGDLIGGR